MLLVYDKEDHITQMYEVRAMMPWQAWKGGAIGASTAILRDVDAVTDAVLDDAARVIAICSGPAAVGAQVCPVAAFRL